MCYKVRKRLSIEHFVHGAEVVSFPEVEMYGQYKGRGQTICPLYGSCPLLSVTIIRGSTVYRCMYTLQYLIPFSAICFSRERRRSANHSKAVGSGQIQ